MPLTYTSAQHWVGKAPEDLLWELLGSFKEGRKPKTIEWQTVESGPD